MSIGRTAAITAVGAYVPDEVLSNADLEQMGYFGQLVVLERDFRTKNIKDKPTSFMAIQAVKES